MYIHDSESLFYYSADLYQIRRFLPLRPFENFKQTAGSYTSLLTCNYFVPSVLVSRQDLLPLLFTVCSRLMGKMVLMLRGWTQPLHSALSSCGGSEWPR